MFKTIVDTFNGDKPLLTIKAFDGWDARQKVEAMPAWIRSGKKWFPQYEARDCDELLAMGMNGRYEDLRWHDLTFLNEERNIQIDLFSGPSQ